MTRSARITLFFGDGPHDFMLDVPGLEELQEKTDCGPEEIYARLKSGTWKRPAEIQEPLRIGLVRAGEAPAKAAVLVERYAGPAYLIDEKATAMAVIAATLIGAPDEDKKLGEPKAGKAKLTSSPAKRSRSRASTAAPA